MESKELPDTCQGTQRGIFDNSNSYSLGQLLVS